MKEGSFMQWMEIAIHTTTAGSDIVSDILMNNGSTGTEIIDRADLPDLTQPGVYWELYDQKMLDNMPEDVIVKGWFEINESFFETLSAVNTELLQLKSTDNNLIYGELNIEEQSVNDEDWSEVWKKYYKPFRIGERLVIKPSWEDYIGNDNECIVELDPGMAFGTGTHETTYMCMEMLCKYLKEDMRVMDIGTGSGILAITAAKLGAKQVLAIDIDPDAVKVANENCERNSVGDKVKVVIGDLVKSEAMHCDLAVANIVADAICMLSVPITKHLENDGLLICSGIIRERESDVLTALENAKFDVIDRFHKGEWVALCAKKR